MVTLILRTCPKIEDFLPPHNYVATILHQKLQLLEICMYIKHRLIDTNTVYNQILEKLAFMFMNSVIIQKIQFKLFNPSYDQL